LLALPAFYLYVVAEHYFQIVQTSVYKHKINSGQAIQHYIKKSTLNLIIMIKNHLYVNYCIS
jgi:hypothetical protein